MVVKSKMPMGDVVLYVMALASKKSGIEKFSELSIYSAFARLSLDYPDFFPGLYFRTLAGSFPHSGRLEDILFRAGTWDCISHTGPHMSDYRVSEKILANVKDEIVSEYGKEILS